MFSGESEAPERPVEGRHERVTKGQVIPATFWDFFAIVGRQHGVGAICVAAAFCVGLSPSQMRVAGRCFGPHGDCEIQAA